MKKNLILCLITILCLCSCSKDSNEIDDDPTSAATINGTIEGIDSYGMLIPSFTPQQMLEAGFNYSDLVDIQIGDNIKLYKVPFVTGFNEVGVLDFFFCDYNKLNNNYGIGQLNGNFKVRIGGNVGDKISVTVSKPLGYYDTWQIMKSVYYYDKDKYYPDETMEEFANFREITTTGMARGILYRSSNPLNPKDNATRYAVVDSLAKHYGIQTEIDLADTKEKVNTYATSPDYSQYKVGSGYCYNELFLNNKTATLGLTADAFTESFMQSLGNGLRFMKDNQPPYLLHCNEGKDRCGYVSMLLEALAGASYEELAADYMKTFENFYLIENGDNSYKTRQRLSIDRLVWLMGNYQSIDDYSNINWENIDPTTVNLQQAARDYIKACGLSDEECTALYHILHGSK